MILRELFKQPQANQIVNEGIDHPEDLIIANGSKGAERVVQELINLQKDAKTVTVKWDGFPAVVFGRDKSGALVFTDKHMYDKVAKGKMEFTTVRAYDEQRGANRNSLWEQESILRPALERIVPAGQDFYYMGDLMWTGTPSTTDGYFTFKPNTVEYRVEINSELGNTIAKSGGGIAVHTYIPGLGAGDTPLLGLKGLRENEGITFLVGEMRDKPKVSINPKLVKQTQAVITTHGPAVDKFIADLGELKGKSVITAMGPFITNMLEENDISNDIVPRFLEFVKGRLSGAAAAKLLGTNKDGWLYQKDGGAPGLLGIWTMWAAVTDLKLHVKQQIDTQQKGSEIIAITDGVDAHEGYVFGAGKDKLKLIDRLGFSRANFAKHRVPDEEIEAKKNGPMAAFSFGRMNPPTLGHKLVMAKTAEVGGENSFIFLSNSSGTKDDPLAPATKVAFIKQIYPEFAKYIVTDAVQGPIYAANWLYAKGFRNITFIGGSDRLGKNPGSIEKLLNGWNSGPVRATDPAGAREHVVLNFVSSGERDADAAGVQGISGSLARKYAAESNEQGFQQATGVGPNIKVNNKTLYQATREGMGIQEPTAAPQAAAPVAAPQPPVRESKTEKSKVKELSNTRLLNALIRSQQPSKTENLTLDQQFDIIEEMVEQLAQEHGVDPEVIWEDFDAVDDVTLFESAAWHRKAGKSKTGGLNKKGVASYRREHPGSKLQTAVTTKPSKLKPGSKAAKRRKSFCARMGGVKGPMKDEHGKPTRKALALRKWNCNEGISENFADGKNPQDKGDSKRHGVPTKSSVSNLRRVAKQGGRKGQLAHWMANMKAGRAKNESDQGVAEGSLDEIGYADELDSSSISPNNLMKSGKVIGNIEGNDVIMLSSGSQTVYILKVDDQATAFVGFDGNNLKNIKNFTQTPGVIRALIGYLIHKKNMTLVISPNEPLTSEGLKWLIRLINEPRGLIIKDRNGKEIDPMQLKQEWQHTKKTGTPGTTEITVTESVQFGNKLRENELKRNADSLLMPFNFYTVRTKTQGVSEGINLKFKTTELASSEIPKYAVQYFEAHNIDTHHQKFISNVKLLAKNKLDESTENIEIQPFIQTIAKVDSVDNIKIGDKFSVLAFEIRFAWREIDVFGFTEPKEVTDINLHRDGTINYIKFSDGDRYPRVVAVTHNNKPIVHTAYFNNGNNASRALTLLTLKVPDNWDLDISNIKGSDLTVNKDGITETALCKYCLEDPCSCDDSHGFVNEESKISNLPNEFLVRELTTQEEVIDYIRHALIPEMRAYNVPITPNNHFTRLSSSVFEGISKVTDSGKEFLKVFKGLDQRHKMKIKIGATVSILNIRMSQDFVELFGFKTPKIITKIYREPTDNKIIQLEFNNNPEDVWPRQPLASVNGQIIMHSVLFPDAGSLEKALTMLYLSKPNDLTISSHITETDQGINEGMSAAVRMARAADRQRARSDASLARVPSSIPKSAPEKAKPAQTTVGEEDLRDAKDNPCWKGYHPVGTKKKSGKTVPNCVPISEDVEDIMGALINKIITNEAISNNRK